MGGDKNSKENSLDIPDAVEVTEKDILSLVQDMYNNVESNFNSDLDWHVVMLCHNCYTPQQVSGTKPNCLNCGGNVLELYQNATKP